MKSPTSLIRFRNAVGVMLAMSALFAVVISAVTITQERALGQTTNPTVTLTVTSETVEEGTAAAFTVTLSEAVDSAETDDVVIPIIVTDGTAVVTEDYTVPDPSSVTFTPGGAATGTLDIATVDDSDAGPAENFMVSLGDLPEGYDAGATTSFTITILDETDNTAATGDVTINFNDKDGNLITEDADTDPATPETPVVGRIAKSGEALVANTSAIFDTDNVVGTNDPATEHDDDDVELTFVYQWIRTNDGSTTADDDDVVIDGATSSTYDLTDDDVGDTFALQVWVSDQHGNGDANANTDSTDTTAPIGENSNGQTLTRVSLATVVAYNLAKPFIIIGALQPEGDEMRLEPGTELTRDVSGMTSTMTNDVTSGSNLIGDDGMDITVDLDNDDPDNDGFLEDGTTAATARTTVTMDNVTFTWHRNGMPIEECEDTTGLRSDPAAETDTFPCDGATYTLTNDDVAKTITLVATYTTRDAVAESGTVGDPGYVAPMDAVMASIESGDIGRVFSPSKSTGMPTISGIGQVGQTLTLSTSRISDTDGLDDVMYTYQWKRGGNDVEGQTSTSYLVTGADVGHKISVVATFTDDLGDPEMISSADTLAIGASPGQISRIEPAIRGVTVSGGDTVILSVDIYGLQDSKDNKLSGTFDWSLKDGGSVSDDTDREIEYTAPNSPGTYTIVASLEAVDCLDEDDENACKAEFTVRVRRPSAAQPEAPAPANPPGDIPELLADDAGNQYAVFTPEEGGSFSGEGYSITAAAGAVPNNEFIGIRMSDDGAASNAGMTHQRYTLGGNMYGVHAVDSSSQAVSAYALEDPATVCVPLPDELRQNISDLAVVAINSDGSLTILSAQVRISDAGTMVCGGLSNLPASVAVGSAGAPAAIPTPTPEPTPVAPETGGTAPASSTMVLWALLLGIATLALGSVLVISRRRESSVRNSR